MSVTFVLMVAARLLVPLAIPRFPLPGVLASLVLDAVDQTVFQRFGGLPPDYQSYDKALDLYYLVVAYASTLRNWTDPVAFGVARFLWYYRLIGTTAFELTGERALLLIFPNTFEYFFIAYELVRLRWNPHRLPSRVVVGSAAAIWIVVKLPQEWWLHIAQLDLTDVIATHQWLAPVGVAVLLLVLLVAWSLRAHLPAPDWALTVDVDAHRPGRDVAGPSPSAVRSLPFWSSVAEKTVLLGLISLVFAKALSVRASDTQIVVVVAVFVLANGALSQWFARRGTRWRTTAAEFAATAALNGGGVGVFSLLRSRIDADVEPGKALFLVLLLSFVITLYDRYRCMRERRLRSTAEAAPRRGPDRHEPQAGVPLAPRVS